MQDDLIESIDNNGPLFRSVLQQALSNNLTFYLISMLANLLLFDFFNRSESIQKTPKKYIEDCANNVSSQLGHQVVTDESFDSAMSLFTTAISQAPQTEYKDKDQQKQMVDAIASMYFSDVTGQDLQNVKSVIAAILQEKGAKPLLEFLRSDGPTFKTIVNNAFQKHTSNHDAINNAIHNISSIAATSYQLKQNINYYKQISSKILFVASLFGGISGSVAMLGAASPFVMLPIAALSLQYGPVIGEKFGEKLSLLSSNVQRLKSSISDKKQSMLIDRTPMINKSKKREKEKELGKTISKEIIKDVKHQIAKTLDKSDTNAQHHKTKTKSRTRGL